MTEPQPAAVLPRYLRWLASDITLGTLLALLGVFTAAAAFQASMADSDQNRGEIEGMQLLNNANAEYLTANQEIVQDYTNFDSWYLNQDDPELADYYTYNFSEELTSALERSSEDPFDDEYYTAMYSYPDDLFDQSDARFDIARQHDERGDRLQLVVMMTAVGLAFAAWASLLHAKNRLRLLFAALAIAALATGVVTYVMIPSVSA